MATNAETGTADSLGSTSLISKNNPLETLYHWRNGVWTTLMENEKPIGSPSDFGHLTAFEREKAEALRRAAQQPTSDAEDPDSAFNRAQARIDKIKADAAEARARFEAGEVDAVTAQEMPRKLFHLLCSKSADKKIRVVGMYSSREALANGLAEGVGAYAMAGLVLGTVEFDLSIKVDQPPIPPS